ncbi:hypothetical protein HPB50_012714 [Hyalomma asiaticum]|uniref:Uncharacterized protein n=1 Tax=Hyalomma asiaticum TaxID=266040 RepID=A0ACB7TC28_HYAAI|nr:hypothetical protein HPB50_012714 [Hyalomma asiaticum]
MDTDKLIALGKELDLEGAELREWVEEQLDWAKEFGAKEKETDDSVTEKKAVAVTDGSESNGHLVPPGECHVHEDDGPSVEEKEQCVTSCEMAAESSQACEDANCSAVENVKNECHVHEDDGPSVEEKERRMTSYEMAAESSRTCEEAECSEVPLEFRSVDAATTNFSLWWTQVKILSTPSTPDTLVSLSKDCEFLCANSMVCIKKELVCNAVPNCPEGIPDTSSHADKSLKTAADEDALLCAADRASVNVYWWIFGVGLIVCVGALACFLFSLFRRCRAGRHRF